MAGNDKLAHKAFRVAVRGLVKNRTIKHELDKVALTKIIRHGLSLHPPPQGFSWCCTGSLHPPPFLSFVRHPSLMPECRLSCSRRTLDPAHTGAVSLAAFEQWFERDRHAHVEDEDELAFTKQAFDAFDADGGGTIRCSTVTCAHNPLAGIRPACRRSGAQWHASLTGRSAISKTLQPRRVRAGGSVDAGRFGQGRPHRRPE